MDLNNPIDINAVNTAAVKYKDVLKPLHLLSAANILTNCTPFPFITNSLTLGRIEGGTISKKYTGAFTGDRNLGTIHPRTMMVYPCVAEMKDEPERYRRTFITEVSGGLWDKKHPFEVWIINYGILVASQDLHDALFNAKYNSSPDKTDLIDSFDGWGSILMNEKTAGSISKEKSNLVMLGELTTATIGTQLLEMWRSRHPKFRDLESVMWMSNDVADMYDDWLSNNTVQLESTDQSGQRYLKGTNRKCRIIRTSGFPAGSNLVLLTVKENMAYGFDKASDMQNMKAFASGNPYLFTATMKYVFGTQFQSINGNVLCINEAPLNPTELAQEKQPE